MWVKKALPLGIIDRLRVTNYEFQNSKKIIKDKKLFFFRILEFEIENLEMTGGGTETIEVELWDCSGNQR